MLICWSICIIIMAIVTITPDIIGERKYAWNFNEFNVSLSSSFTSSCVLWSPLR